MLNLGLRDTVLGVGLTKGCDPFRLRFMRPTQERSVGIRFYIAMLESLVLHSKLAKDLIFHCSVLVLTVSQFLAYTCNTPIGLP